MAQQKISSVVISTTGSPLVGATVAVKSTNVAITTDKAGSFSITAKTGDILEISFIGYRSKQITVSQEFALKITLSESITNLDEVIVTGYTSHRIAMMQSSNGMESPVKINDLVNTDGTAAGTEVIIKMPMIEGV